MKAQAALQSLLFVASTAAVLSLTTTAGAAGDAQGMGEKYQLFISADRLVPLFAYTRGSVTQVQNGVELTTSHTGSGISFLWGRDIGYPDDFSNFPANVHALPRVAFDFTVINRLTVGAAIAFGFGLGGSVNRELVQGNVKSNQTTDSPTGTAIGLAPRVGYILPLSDHFAFWPRAGFAFYSVSFKQDVINNNAVVRTDSLSDSHLSLDLDPQFAIVPVPNFFFTLGPLLNIPLSGTRSVSSSNSNVTVSSDIALLHFGITAGVGGYIGF